MLTLFWIHVFFVFEPFYYIYQDAFTVLTCLFHLLVPRSFVLTHSPINMVMPHVIIRLLEPSLLSPFVDA